MQYTVQKLATCCGVSVRTLHYYDEIGLLKPSKLGKNGYRYYEEKELLKLQQILFFRELEFPLAKIIELISSPYFNEEAAFTDHKNMLLLKKKRLEKLLRLIDKTMQTTKNNKQINNAEQLYDAFKDDDVKEYHSEVEARWGNTAAYKQSMARVGKMTKKEMEELKENGKILTQKLADSMDKEVKSKEVQDLIAEHYKGIQFFYDCQLEMYRNLGKMYVEDARFTAYYDKFRPGLAVFMKGAIEYYCDLHEIKS